MKKWTIRISVLFLLYSCIRSDFKKNITAKNNFWYIFEYDTTCRCFKNSNYGYHFFHCGSLRYMNWDHSSSKLSEFYVEDIKSSKEWSFNAEDSVAEINDFSYKVLKSYGDSVHLRYLNSKKEIWLINLKNNNPNILRVKK